MKFNDLLKLYSQDGVVQTISAKLNTTINEKIFLKNISGSLDAIFGSAIFKNVSKNLIFVLNDKEEASYFINDMQGMLSDVEILFFPESYKKPYQFEEIDNANVLMRAEVLTKISASSIPYIIVTFPAALTEKVINKKSLKENTFDVKVGEKVDLNFIAEILQTYDFEKTDFVYEAGQYSLRGGIVDVFSYSHDYPYRIELFGNEIESIRTFDPNTQLSIEKKLSISIIPNVQTKLIHEVRESFLNYAGKNTALIFKDIQFTLDIINKYFQKATDEYTKAKKLTGGSSLITDPEFIFETSKIFTANLEGFSTLEFGNQQYYQYPDPYIWKSKPQPSFNKDFDLLGKDLIDKQNQGYTNIIASDSYKQIERLTTIFEELDPFLKFQSVGISLKEGFIDDHLKIVCYTDHQIFERFHKFRTKERFSKSKALTLKELRTLHPGDFVTHVDYGIGRFAGLEKVEVGGKQQEAIRLVYRDDDLLYVSIHALHKISRYSGKEGGPPQMSKLGSGEWDTKKKKVKKQVKDIAKELISLYAKRKSAPGFAFSKDNFMQVELESSFIYEDTPDQAKATNAVKEDMEMAHPMDRLVCGDVGFGKTEVAIRAAFKAVCDIKQVAVLVPTTILAMQHYKTFKERLGNLPCIVEYINRFKSTQQIKETIKRVAEGKTQILIGTHRIISKDITFKDLGLLIIDEEQKFGVKVKERLKEIKVNVDTLTLTATPIPRTLHFSLMGARDLSIIATPPPNRQPVTTAIHVFDEIIIRDAIMLELKRGGQVFLVHNRVKDIDELADMVKRLVPDSKIGIAHGQMDGDKLEKAMMGFVDGEFDVLVSTNIIESGLDIPNANTIIINKAHMFGLSDLHQMRGRVGRSNKKAYCYLLTPPLAVLPSDSRKRLSALEEFSDLGDGFKVAMRDLDIRGAGNLLGAEQSGFITDLGFDMYHKILDEAIQELKQTEFQYLFVKELEQLNLKDLKTDCIIETDLSVIIPDTYVSNISERLSLYSTLDNIKDIEGLKEFEKTVIDRFGQFPQEVIDLIETVKLRWKAETLGFEKMVLKNEILKLHFPPSEKEIYYKSKRFTDVIKFIQNNPKKCKLKETNKKLILTFDNIESINAASITLQSMILEEAIIK